MDEREEEAERRTLDPMGVEIRPGGTVTAQVQIFETSGLEACRKDGEKCVDFISRAQKSGDMVKILVGIRPPETSEVAKYVIGETHGDQGQNFG